MKKSVLIAALLMAMPLWAQNPPAQTPPAQTPPQEAAPQTPQLEKPEMAPEEEKPAEKPAATAPAAAPATAPAAAPGAAPGTAPATTPAAGKPGAKAAAQKPITPSGNGKTVEEIVARVNNEIITKSELDKARASAEEEARQDCQGRCNSEQVQAAVADAQKNALKNLIDQSLLAQRGKDLDIHVDADVIKQLDAIRISNHLKDMDDLERAVTSQGINWDDFKNNIRNRILTQAVIGREVGSHITISHEEAMKYYDAHKQDFVRPEQVALRAIEIKTEGKKESEIPGLKEKTQKLHDRVNEGEDFGELAKRFSDGPTAAQGGYLGVYKKGELSKDFEVLVFNMKKNQLTDVIETKQGFLFMQVMEHYAEGEQPFDKVEGEITDRLYSERMEPAMREYLKTLREQSYVVVKPGYQDMAGGGNSEIQEVSATPEASKDKKGKKKYLLFGKTTEPKS